MNGNNKRYVKNVIIKFENLDRCNDGAYSSFSSENKNDDYEIVLENWIERRKKNLSEINNTNGSSRAKSSGFINSMKNYYENQARENERHSVDNLKNNNIPEKEKNLLSIHRNSEKPDSFNRHYSLPADKKTEFKVNSKNEIDLYDKLFGKEEGDPEEDFLEIYNLFITPVQVKAEITINQKSKNQPELIKENRKEKIEDNKAIESYLSSNWNDNFAKESDNDFETDSMYSSKHNSSLYPDEEISEQDYSFPSLVENIYKYHQHELKRFSPKRSESQPNLTDGEFCSEKEDKFSFLKEEKNKRQLTAAVSLHSKGEKYELTKQKHKTNNLYDQYELDETSRTTTQNQQCLEEDIAYQSRQDDPNEFNTAERNEIVSQDKALRLTTSKIQSVFSESYTTNNRPGKPKLTKLSQTILLENPTTRTNLSIPEETVFTTTEQIQQPYSESNTLTPESTKCEHQLSFDRNEAELREKIQLITQIYTECQALMQNRQEKLENIESTECLEEQKKYPSACSINSTNDNNNQIVSVLQTTSQNPENNCDEKTESEEKSDVKDWENADGFDFRYSQKSADSITDFCETTNTALLEKVEAIVPEETNPDLIKIKYIIEELVNTETNYLKILAGVITNYKMYLQDIEMPAHLIGKDSYLFGNILNIYMKQTQFFNDLNECDVYNYMQIANVFISHKSLFQLYPIYSRNKPKADYYLHNDFKQLLIKRQRELGEDLDLASHLLTPIQRIGKYILILESLNKELRKNNLACPTLLKAIKMVKHEMKRGNDYIAVDSIVKTPPLKINDIGSFIMREKFLVKSPKKYETVIFFFDEILIFTIPMPKNQEEFIYHTEIRLHDLGPVVLEKYSLKFRLRQFLYAKEKKEICYVLEASSEEIRQRWFNRINARLLDQLYECKAKQMQQYEMEGKIHGKININKNKEVDNNIIGRSTFYRK